MKTLLDKLFDGQTLNSSEAKELLRMITSEEVNEVQIVAAISALKMRTITSSELNGFRSALLDQALMPNLLTTEAIDVCGTGGDGKNTFNISTLAALIIAGAGYKVIKHGNYGVSSLVGSSTILEYLGYKFSKDEALLNEQLSETNMCFLHAPLFHPALKKVAGIRKALGVRTFFNFLGPLVNPVQPKYQLTGVYNLQLLRVYKEILSAERDGFKVVHSLDGYDEVSLTGPFKTAERTREMILYPEDLKLKQIEAKDIFGGETLDEAARIFTAVLSGKGTTEQSNVVLANAALGIQCFDPTKSFPVAFEEAKNSVYSLKAKEGFEQAIAISQRIKELSK
jgi:anthranilate phosphoribosyltransferase